MCYNDKKERRDSMPLLDDLTKKAAKFTEKTIEKSDELAKTAKTKISIQSAKADLDDEYKNLGEIYYTMIKDQQNDVSTQSIVDKIKEIQERIEQLENSLEK